MKLRFALESTPAGFRPVCSVDAPGPDAGFYLAYLLMDHGGLDQNASLAWLREGLSRVNLVLTGATGGRADWDRENWGAAITSLETKLYSLHDEQSVKVMPTAAFRSALAGWVGFIESGVGSMAVDVELD